ncbi:hypothetical protein Anas_08526 [Armadillidium nasatum]|uniref:Uncharacterized protein n=1 Tax=Armadillidium nasatum TaxID=96803 RepID=A0A5N5TNS4_9CRUS|nr:hypothetical protein Anas_08526 [Armadillidium nasatum]
MGSQQYKFCGPSPRLPMCKRSEPAYTHAIFFDQSTYDILGIMANLHCLCLPPRTHVFHESTDDVIENMHVLGTTHTCSLLPFCDFESPCKEISLARTSSIVTTNCQCRKGFVCPTLSTEASPNNLNENFANGKVFSILCQPWY